MVAFYRGDARIHIYLSEIVLMEWREMEIEITGMNRVYKLRNNRELQEWASERRKVYFQIIRVNHRFAEDFQDNEVLGKMMEFRSLIPDLKEMSRDARIVLRRLDILLHTVKVRKSFTDFEIHKNKAESIHESSIRYRAKWNDIMSLSEKAHRILNTDQDIDDTGEKPPFCD